MPRGGLSLGFASICGHDELFSSFLFGGSVLLFAEVPRICPALGLPSVPGSGS